MTLDSKTLGNKIAEARKKSNLSQAELAKHVSISPQAVGKWERGESMPDISTLNKLAELLKVDLNYFSDTFQRKEAGSRTQPPQPRKEFSLGFDMSKGNWVDVDFSGIKDLKEKLSSSNIQGCKFLNSKLVGINFLSNEIADSDFSGSDIRQSKFKSSEISKSEFKNCSLIDTEFKSCEIVYCDFTNSNFEGAEFISSEFRGNTIEKSRLKLISFKNSSISTVTFDGTVEDCSFENCSFEKVEFRNALVKNTFFKNNEGLRHVRFTNCKVDSLTYAFLKSGKANLAGITLLN